MSAPYEQAFAIRNLAISAIIWTDIQGALILPIDCSLIIIFNPASVNILLRSDPNNANSQVTIAPGQQFEIGGAYQGLKSANRHRFPLGGAFPVCSLMSSSGPQTILVESIQ